MANPKLPFNVVSITKSTSKYEDSRHLVIHIKHLQDCEYIKVVQTKDTVRLEKQYLSIHKKSYKVTDKKGRANFNVLDITVPIGRYYIDEEKTTTDVIVINLREPANV